MDSWIVISEKSNTRARIRAYARNGYFTRISVQPSRNFFHEVEKIPKWRAFFGVDSLAQTVQIFSAFFGKMGKPPLFFAEEVIVNFM